MSRYNLELDSGELIDIREIAFITKIRDLNGEFCFRICLKNREYFPMIYHTKDEAELARFKYVQQWGAILDIETVKSGIYEKRVE